MTSFGWKRKAGDNVSKSAATTFQEVTGQQDPDGVESDVSLSHWGQVAKQRKVILLEDAKTKSKRLKDEGSILAEAERYWEAITKWDEALQLTPDSENILDMKAQALLILHEVFPAVQTAVSAVKLNPRWWAAHQTLGRAQLGLGEIKMAVSSFSKAIHLNPCDNELWEEDLKWACSLLREKQRMNLDTKGEDNLVSGRSSQKTITRATSEEDEQTEEQSEECEAAVQTT
ncbi:tetratricopeptide repeat protein 33-like [Patiria miniata]|uniref:Tetratricopeptide repeat protein 33 n=1 Tax=Patiria miniata TaxID=46514 RepID=A0A914B0U9_PATMI|nr:tetratricopeptide repeat protein 33-like [Patiria miniata]XP_038048674.1 tetratricopeptide repeat protein 33-like [Patiria miniata]XP_038070008.1 tetratricopeptide repeat protein 33-like [Patiria miniata]XP_038070009.1 tetratricopeptide repeat protein 33-like [Patiria miniata]XP_038070010.1 tetratricopeptide repeat protein 33-like [Patiria miniata]